MPRQGKHKKETKAEKGVSKPKSPKQTEGKFVVPEPRKRQPALPSPQEVREEQKRVESEEAIKQDSSSSDSEFLFEEGSEEGSTDLSSSGTDEFARGDEHIQLSLDPKTSAELKAKVEKHKKPIIEIKHTDPRGVIYLGHLPYGFFEPQMRTFFSQFGEVTQLRLSRNKKGKSRHYAFVEFLDPVVATIVADTMNGYIMFTRMLVCKVVPPEKVHPKMFMTRKKQNSQSLNRQRTAKTHVRDPKDSLNKLLSKEEAKRKKLEAIGIEYNFPGVKGAMEPRQKETLTVTK